MAPKCGGWASDSVDGRVRRPPGPLRPTSVPGRSRRPGRHASQACSSSPASPSPWRCRWRSRPGWSRCCPRRTCTSCTRTSTPSGRRPSRSPRVATSTTPPRSCGTSTRPCWPVLLTPFALLDALPAYRLFALLTLLLVVGAVLVVARELRLTARVTTAVVLVVLASSPLHGTLLLGQIYGLLLVGLVAGWVAERRGHPLLAAACYGVTVALKPSLAPLLLLPLALRRWRPAAAGFGGGGRGVAARRAGRRPGQRAAVAADRPHRAGARHRGQRLAARPRRAARAAVRDRARVLGLAVLTGTLAVLGRRRRQRRPGRHRAVGRAGGGPADVADRLAQLPDAALARRAAAPRPRRPGPFRPGRAAVLLAVAVIPVSWNALWPAGEWWALPGRMLYCAVLLAYWWVLLSSSPLGERPVGRARGRRRRRLRCAADGDGRLGDVRAGRRLVEHRLRGTRSQLQSPAGRPRSAVSGGT